MKENTQITIEDLVNDKALLDKISDVQPEIIDLLASCAMDHLNRKDYVNADKIIEAMRTLAPDHPETLYLYGMRHLEERNISEAEAALSQLLELIRSKEPIGILPRNGCISLFATGASMYMYPAKEAGKHERVHDLFQDIYLEYSKARGTLTQDQRDLDQIANCLERMDDILSQPQIKPAFAETLMVDLRKLLQEKSGGTQPLLSQRCGLNILFPSIAGHDPAAGLPEGIKLDISFPMGFQPLTARPDILYNIEDWLEQPIAFVGKSQTIGEVIKTLANSDGAHAASQERIEREHGEGKSGNLKLLINDDIKHEITYRVCAFIITWLAEYSEFVEAFPILEKYRGKYELNFHTPGFIPNWVNWEGKGFIRVKLET